jgi:hypothetical protein
MMIRKCLGISVFVGLLFLSHEVRAQEIVHALCGTVNSINADKTITLFQDNGSRANFKVMSSSGTRIAFDKKIAHEVTAARDFQKRGAYVILFYFGGEENRTFVALKNLGAGPFSATTGEVTKWNGHDHTISVTDKDGNERSFKIDAQTIAETYLGAVDGSKVDMDKGERVRVVSSVKNGTPTALFVREQ